MTMTAKGERRPNPSLLFTGMGMWARFGVKDSSGRVIFEEHKFYAFGFERDEEGCITDVRIAGRTEVFKPQTMYETLSNVIGEEGGDKVLQIEGMNQGWFRR